MKIVSFCEKMDYRDFIDEKVLETLQQDLQGIDHSRTQLQVIIADDYDLIKAFRLKFQKELLLLIPVIALINANLSYSIIHQCITTGATALVIRV